MTIVQCKRCGVDCRADAVGNPDAEIMRYADEGTCASCGLTVWLKQVEPIASILAARGPELLLAPQVQQQVGRVLAYSDASLAEIDWAAVVEQWEKP